MQAAGMAPSMGAILDAHLRDSLTATRDLGEHVLAAAHPCVLPWSATGQVRANAAAFALRCVHVQVHHGAGSDPKTTAECTT